MMTRAVILGMAALCMCGAFAADETDTYTNRDFNFSLQVPKAWQKKERFSNTTVAFIAPKPEQKTPAKTDPFLANITLIAQEIPKETTLKQFGDASLAGMDKMLVKYKELERKDVTLGAIPATRVTYTYAFDAFTLKAVVYVAVAGKHGFTVTATADEKTFDASAPVFDAAAASFKTVE
jgi:hypothetical protein